MVCVSNNTNRAEKQLVATKGKGDKISLISASNDEQEALAIADSIKKDIKVNKSTFQDFAILYRTNAQSRMIEQILMREGIPYNIVGGTKFYDRKEIKNVIAYLTLICNPNDDIALKRIINFPVRGLGEKSIKLFQDLAKETSKDFFNQTKDAWKELPRGIKIAIISGGSLFLLVQIATIANTVGRLIPEKK